VRFFFAFLGVNERNRDVSTVTLDSSLTKCYSPPVFGSTPDITQESLSAVGDPAEMVGIVAILSCEVRHRDLARSMQRSSRLASLLWAVGVVTFLLSVASPYDDAFQQEVFRPKSIHVAVRRLPSANASTRKSGAVPRISVVALANLSTMPLVFGDVEPNTGTLLAIRFRSDLGLRSPPPIR
jgi:hypothetical protein